MNNFIVMAEIVEEPQLRYTSDNQLPITEMVVEFPGIRAEDAASKVKVVGWGNLAQEIQENFHVGDRVIVEGRLTMLSVDNPNGFKEKKAEMTASRVHRVGVGEVTSTQPEQEEPAAARPAAAKPAAAAPARSSKPPEPAPAPMEYDDIPF
ncbi:MAG: single-stranded DNA-binding protein [Kaiparowitsia implicata GSE-PSE-MK54-09C]|jgi:single-stranded DNA-binding protein|nr:single-stranded DNA-binding protein [Kaiparowitsia implicata GSE-PSE-MK54-09C]